MRYSFLAAVLCSALRLSSQWTSNVAANTPVCALAKSQQNAHIVSDDNAGAIITWQDNRTSSLTASDIYAQRMNSSGLAIWPLNGLSICTNTAAQSAPAITNVGGGSAIIVWEDERNGNYDIYAQKVDSSGNVLWTTNGVPVCTKATNQKSPRVVGDGAGGAIIVWEDSLNFYWDVYAQRISASGNAMWAPNGVAVCTALNSQINPRIDYGLSNGAIITWQDKRNNSDYDIYAQALDANGNPLWTVNGIAICATINTQSNPKIEPDGSGGAFIGWEDKRNGLDYDIYAQHVSSTGTASWTANGLAVVSTASNQSALDMKYLGSSGVCFSWKDNRSGSYAVYAQLFSPAGNAILQANGVQLSSALKSINPNNAADGAGGAVIAWQDSTASGWNISSQKLSSSGQAQWASGGIVVSSATDDQINVAQVSDNSGGTIYAWEDRRNGVDKDIYCQKLSSNGTVTGIVKSTAGVLSASCYPNPIVTGSVIRISAESNIKWTVSIYDAVGKIVTRKAIEGESTFCLDPKVFEKGTYFYTIVIPSFNQVFKGKFISVANE